MYYILAFRQLFSCCHDVLYYMYHITCIHAWGNSIMAYRKETLSKLINNMRAIRKEYERMDASDLKVTVSCGNRKIGKVMNVSTAPILACGNCKECKGYCYDVKACIQYRNVINARVKNLVIATKYRDLYFNQIESRIARRRTNKYFRWHVAGDILDIDYFSRMVEIARRHEDFIFWTYTKMYGIVNEYCDLYGRDAIPGNLHIMFSKWDGLAMDNPYNFPVFACKMRDGNKDPMPWEAMYKCPGNCDICKEHKTGCIGGMNTYADEH